MSPTFNFGGVLYKQAYCSFLCDRGNTLVFDVFWCLLSCAFKSHMFWLSAGALPGLKKAKKYMHGRAERQAGSEAETDKSFIDSAPNIIYAQATWQETAK